MRKMSVKYLLLLALIGLACAAVQAQEVVHAVAGVVTAVDPAANTITIQMNDGSQQTFPYKKELRTDIEFDKDVRNGTTPPANFKKTGNHVVAYYFGEGNQQTLVAIKDFGAKPLEIASGTVVSSRHHVVVLKTDKGATETFGVAKDASAETPGGVVSGYKLDVDNGTRMTIRYIDENGTKLAQFIHTALG